MARHAATAGFTLVELLAALLILALGVTGVLGVFSNGIRTEQTSELVRDAARLVETVREELKNGDQLGKASEALPPDRKRQTHPDFPFLTYDVTFSADGADDGRLIVEIAVRWLRRGEEVSEIYSFRLPRERPLWARVAEAVDRMK